MIDPDEALKIILASVHPRPAIRIPLESACGWVLAEDVRADRDQPPADRSAMDGYAVRSAGPAAERIESHGSADIIAASAGDGVIVIPAGARELRAGEVVDFRPWRAIP